MNTTCRVSLSDLIHRTLPAEPWLDGDNIPWDDPAFSARMLKEHLSQSHDLASRRSETVNAQVCWLHERLVGPSAVLDVACGPGLYVHELARLGHRCVGIDFSPASIEYATRVAQVEELDCQFRCQDIRRAGFGIDFDLVTLLYGQINVFRRREAQDILRRVHQALVPGGQLILEPQQRAAVVGTGVAVTSWESARAGLFSNEPHLLLHERFWHEEEQTTTERWHVIDAGSGTVTRHAMSYLAYESEELCRLVQEAGFSTVESMERIGGADLAGTRGLWGLVATV